MRVAKFFAPEFLDVVASSVIEPGKLAIDRGELSRLSQVIASSLSVAYTHTYWPPRRGPHVGKAASNIGGHESARWLTLDTANQPSNGEIRPCLIFRHVLAAPVAFALRRPLRWPMRASCATEFAGTIRPP
jgi:hypothetical protein